MREIKFRAWLTLSDYDDEGNDKDYHAMIDGVSVSSGGYVGFSLDQGSHAFGGDIFERAVENGNVFEYEEWCTWEGPFKLMQYTGLKDKNGVEIYEGDVLLYLPRKLFVDSEQSRRYGKVYWKEKDACFGLLTFRIDDREANYDEPFPMAGIEKHEVIGNIYENPELLESK